MESQYLFEVMIEATIAIAKPCVDNLENLRLYHFVPLMIVMRLLRFLGKKKPIIDSSRFVASAIQCHIEKAAQSKTEQALLEGTVR